ncbi:hypothetical protein [Nonomuraea salmonea]|uniref:hypothetical protein n=1 Tax=Nonomuraea salmonea TaxID=46181 RepID=UPI0031E9B79E
MRLFGRKDADEGAGRQGEAIAGFWTWWQETRPRLDSLVASGETGDLEELLAPAVSAIDPGLVWEVAPGKEAAHALVVTAAGDAELRSLAHRWVKGRRPPTCCGSSTRRARPIRAPASWPSTWAG